MRISDWSSDVCSSDLIATAEANADLRYKQAIVEYSGTDIVYSNLFTGVHGNYLRASIEAAGFDPDHLPQRSEAHTSEPQSLMRISYAVFCLKKKKIYSETSIKINNSAKKSRLQLQHS